jgi:hypothetical protein
MNSNKRIGSTALLIAWALLPTAVWADQPEALVTIPAPIEPAALHPNPPAAHPFAALAGSWTGGGTIALTGEIQEKLRCRATYNYNQGSSNLALAIRCASDNYKFELTSNVVERRGQISGQWSEAAYKVSGSINGRIAGNRITALAQSDGLNADLAVVTNGNHQSVTITPKATYVISVQIALNRH